MMGIGSLSLGIAASRVRVRLTVTEDVPLWANHKWFRSIGVSLDELAAYLRDYGIHLESADEAYELVKQL